MARTYDEAAAYVRAASRFGVHPSLDAIAALSKELGRPQDDFQVVQVAGTNGKTSVARMTAALLHMQGSRVGVYTSPTLGRLSDQVEIDGREVTREAYSAAIDAVADAAEAARLEPTEFEITTAAALWSLREARVDWGVLEVGMGGRWGATSVATNVVAVITGVDIDHADHLGSTREAIAVEKAQIIGRGSRVVLGPGVAGVFEVFLARAQDVDAPVETVARVPVTGDVVFEVVRIPDAPGGETELSVRTPRHSYDGIALRAPSYQAANAAVAIAAAETALGGRLDASATRAALAGITFPGRFELLASDPPVIADGAHNPAAAHVLAGAIAECMGDTKPVIVLGVLSDKDVIGIVEALTPVASAFVATASTSDRSLPPEDIARVIDEVAGRKPYVAPTVSDALDTARALGSSVVATGSLTVAGEARRALVSGRAK